ARGAEPDDANARDRRRVHGAGTDQVLTTCATGSGACSPRRITSPAARRPVLSRRATAMTAPGGLLRRKLMVRLAVTAPAWPVAPTTAAYRARSARPISMGPATMPPRSWCAARAGSTARAVPGPISVISTPSTSANGCCSASRRWKSARLMRAAAGECVMSALLQCGAVAVQQAGGALLQRLEPACMEKQQQAHQISEHLHLLGGDGLGGPRLGRPQPVAQQVHAVAQ